MNDKNLNHYDNFFLPSDNMEESKKFYRETLGLELKFDFAEKGMVAYKIGKEEAAIILKDKKKYPEVKPAVWFETDNVRELYKKLSGKGVKFLSEPFRIYTGWAVEFTDPSGNLLGIADYIKDE